MTTQITVHVVTNVFHVPCLLNPFEANRSDTKRNGGLRRVKTIVTKINPANALTLNRR